MMKRVGGESVSASNVNAIVINSDYYVMWSYFPPTGEVQPVGVPPKKARRYR